MAAAIRSSYSSISGVSGYSGVTGSVGLIGTPGTRQTSIEVCTAEGSLNFKGYACYNPLPSSMKMLKARELPNFIFNTLGVKGAVFGLMFYLDPLQGAMGVETRNRIELALCRVLPILEEQCLQSAAMYGGTVLGSISLGWNIAILSSQSGYEIPYEVSIHSYDKYQQIVRESQEFLREATFSTRGIDLGGNLGVL